ncbi:MAG: glutamate racemase [Bifidobacteriaceae bacterium]|nr:glutamate racemase [Bifidobacteriaceae bacterium]
MVDQQSPIGVFDSGVGGISTLRTLSAMLPREDFIFYGDSANAPYGEKTADRVYDLTQHAVEQLRSRDVKAIVIACNTATSAAKPELMKRYPDIPFLGIEPAVKLAVDSGKKNILVLATPLTLSLAKFHTQVKRFENQAHIYPLPCPRLAELIERGPAARDDIEEYVAQLLAPTLARVSGEGRALDGAVLGCTHYPFVADIIQRHVGPDVELFTGFEGLGRYLTRQLADRNLLRAEEHAQNVAFMSSKNTPEEKALYRHLFQYGFAQ